MFFILVNDKNKVLKQNGKFNQNFGYVQEVIRAITSVDVKLCKMDKGAHFTQFEQKNTHISGCKLV